VVTKARVIEMESRIVTALSFDLSFISPMFFLERYLRLANLHDDFNVSKMAKELSIRAKMRAAMLDFKPSVIAAASLFLAVSSVHELNSKNC
jgi:hypothetical protein